MWLAGSKFMSDTLEDVLKAIEEQSSIFGIKGISRTPMTELFRLHAVGNQHVFTVKADGTVDVNPQFTVGQAADEFWKWMSSQTNLVQLAIEQAKREERESIAQQVESQGRQWGIMRSMQMTNYADAAQELADLIRK
jgi:glyceraldehyde-3-phosphate dehydrogenase/erythrose-4-phosphate dehydrogenase